MIEVTEELTDTDEESQFDGDLTISVHALNGIQSHSGCTMQLSVIINGARLFSLLDSGSTHNFGDIDVAARARIMLQGLRIYIGNDPFTIDSYGLVLRSFHMVLIFSQHLELLLEQLGQQHLGCFVRTATS
jgi:hypothetical protein